MTPELHLFVLWEKARKVEDRILVDLRREMEIVFVKELAFTGDPAEGYEAFYGSRRPVDGRLKVAKCGGGKFLLVVVRDVDPHYGQRWACGDRYYEANERMYDLKARYREWAGRKHRVHGTTDRDEFARDVLLLTGHTAVEWKRGVPADIALNLPKDARWHSTVEDAGSRIGLADMRTLLENKYLNDVFFTASLRGRECVVKCSSKAAWSIGNEYRLARRMFDAAPDVVAEPLTALVVPDGEQAVRTKRRRLLHFKSGAIGVTARIAGPSLTELLTKGLSDAQADAFAADLLRLARALKATGILHRDLFPDNLLLDADGHLKAIDWQLAIDRNDFREDPWVRRNWKFRYVVFGVNRELGLGVWNDFHALGKILAKFPQTDAVKTASAELAQEAPAMGFADPPTGWTRFRLWLYGCSLRLQMLLRGRRHRKYAQLENRWRTVRCKWD